MQIALAQSAVFFDSEVVMKRVMKSTISIILSILIFFSFCSLGISAEENVVNSTNSDTGIINSNYDSYITKFEKESFPTSNIELNLTNLISDQSNVIINDNLIEMNEEHNNSKFSFSVTEEGFYNLILSYYPSKSGTANIQIGVKIDGEYPFLDAEKLICFRSWKDASNKWRVDSLGNEFTTEQIQTGELIKHTLFDKNGVYSEPFKFYLTKGQHNLEIVLVEEGLSIETISFCGIENTITYKEIEKSYQTHNYSNYEGAPIIIEAEKATSKTSNSLTAKADTNSANISPKSTTTSVVNYIGGDTWSAPGDEITWTFNAPKSGLYKLGFAFKQSYIMNGSVYRQIKIDGKTPFKEASSIEFPYGSGWNYNELDYNDEPCLIYLSEGTHTISLGVTLGVMSDFYKRLSNIVSILGQQYLNISMITGETPDANRDYELFRQIPDLEEVLSKQEDELLKLIDDIEGSSGGQTTQYSSVLRSMAQILKQMLARKYLAHTYMKEYYSKYVSLSASLSELRKMSLAVDRIFISSPEEEIKLLDGNFFSSAVFHIKRFIYSFVGDYNVSSDNLSDNSIKLWINWGNDQAQILSSLIQEDFTPKTGIDVKFELVNASIIQGILTNNQPDVVLHMDRSNPVNYAMRGALYPLNEFSDFESVLDRFIDGAEEPYIYNGKCYAIPDVQNFYIMFYRKDVLDQLGVEVPKTWEEFKEVLAIIQRKNMNAYFPYVKPTGITGSIGMLNLFGTFLTQNNFSVYNNERNANLLANDDIINVFDDFTKYYTEYKIPKTADFFNRFKLGTCPIGIVSYTTYNTLKAAATEIDGKWGIAPIPGTVDENGEINITQCGSGSGCCILNKSKNKESAWEFLKWWTSADVQTRYSQNLESILGPTARIATATVEALGNYSWNADDESILMEQWENVKEIPEVPGSYHLARSLDQAFLEVINGKSTANDAMVKWAEAANHEIARKIAEYE